MNKEFSYSFRIKNHVNFKVCYYTLGSNPNPHYTTSCGLLNHVRSDFNECGQGQENLLPKNSKAYEFYKKWDFLHLHDLTQEQYNEIAKDIEVLKIYYSYFKGNITKWGDGITFSNIVEFDRSQQSKEKPLKIEMIFYNYENNGQNILLSTSLFHQIQLGQKLQLIDSTGLENEGYIYYKNYDTKMLYIQL